MALWVLLCAGCESALSSDLEGKACGPLDECLPGYQCDKPTNICVKLTPELEVPRTNPDPDGSGVGSSDAGSLDAGAGRPDSGSDADAPDGAGGTSGHVDSEACQEGETVCGGKCTATASDVRNCGACDRACSAQANGTVVCSSGRCVIACDAGYALCGTECVNVSSNLEHCGACGRTCGARESCEEGRCVSDCPSGSTLCNGECVNTATDLNNCGACGNACALGVCASGSCTLLCVLKTNCGGSCVDTDSDREHCGKCGKSCDDKQRCRGGECKKIDDKEDDD